MHFLIFETNVRNATKQPRPVLNAKMWEHDILISAFHKFKKELSLWNKIIYLNLNIFRTSNSDFLMQQNSYFEISKVCNIWFQRYSD